jgi:hypothetical protein
MGILVYPVTVYDCYLIGKSSERRSGGSGAAKDKPRKLTAEERMEQLIRPHDKDGY